MSPSLSCHKPFFFSTVLRLSFYLIVTSAALVLSACQTLTSNTTTDTIGSFEAREKQLATLHTWKVKGALGIQRAQEGWSARFNWTQQANAYQLQFFGPLGAGTFRIEGQPGKVTLREGKDKTITAANPETLLIRASGWPMPISNLLYWVRGLPAPGPRGPYQLDSQNHLRRLTQEGWTVYFERYETLGAFTLPNKLVLEHSTTKIRILLKQWEV